MENRRASYDVHGGGEIVLALGILLLPVLARAAPQEAPKPASAAGPPPIVKPIDPKNESLTFRMLEQIKAAHKEVEESPQDPVLGRDHPISPDGVDPWNDVLQVTRDDNPLVSEDCRRVALERTIEVTGKVDAVTKHLEDRHQHWHMVKQGDKEVTLGTYLEHLKKCERVCGPYVGELLRCHVEGVGSHPHMIIYFDVGSPRLAEAESYNFDHEAAEKLATFSERTRSEQKSLILLSRASNLHSGEDIFANQAVATRRADAVQRWLVAQGFPEEKIQTKVICWEPPRLVAGEISEAYGLKEDWLGMSNKQSMDQSVVLVAY